MSAGTPGTHSSWNASTRSGRTPMAPSPGSCQPSYNECMATLRVIDEASSEQLGTSARADDGSIATDRRGQPIFEQIKGGKGWDDNQTFEALLDGGWSTGYASTRA